MATKSSARIRMYRLNELGDCFLVTFTVGAKKSHLLIDCGSFRNSGDSKKRLTEITAQIKKDLGTANIDVVVGTHQHNDHLSGFLHCQTAFEKIGVDQVWLSWLDDPKDKDAKKVGADHNNLRLSLAGAMEKMRAHPATKRAGSRAALSLAHVTDMLGFFGADAASAAPPEVPMLATKILKKLGAKPPKYLEPSDVIDMPGLPADSVRIHVLGPPRAEGSLYRKDPRKGESYDAALASSVRMASAMLSALNKENATENGERPYPFGSQYKRHAGDESPTLKKIQKAYREESNRWRTIDDDWLETAGSLALFLDDFTNNSSLVLAIELVSSGKVLLFAADAQTGNWSSWKDVAWKSGHPGTAKLLERTVFYKVGHHASHNATLVEAFEAMGGDDLCALIPVHKKDPNITKKNGWKMPAKNLFTRLVEKTEGRVLQMDGVNPPESDPTIAKVKKAWQKAGVSPKISDIAIELVID